MCVCEPQSVSIEATCTGAEMSVMSKTRIPSNMPWVEALTLVLSQPALLCGVSTDTKMRLPITDTSP